MKASRRARRKKYFTLAEANAMLPLLKSILRDVVELAQSRGERQERLARLRQDKSQSLGPVYNEELEQIQAELEAELVQDHEKMKGYEKELKVLGVELKDYFTGLIDFPSIMEEREVYLCWRLGEPEVAHWHELETGFAGRQPIMENATRI